jgi:hypothetical protein
MTVEFRPVTMTVIVDIYNLLYAVFIYSFIHLFISGTTVLLRALAASHLRFLYLFKYLIRLFGRQISSSQRPLPTQDSTTQTVTNTHTLNGFEPPVSAYKPSRPSSQTAQHWDRLFYSISRYICCLSHIRCHLLAST